MKRLIALGLCALVPMLLMAEGQPEEMHAGMYPKAATMQDGDVYFVDGQQELQRLLGMKLNTNRARNVILFVADGNGVATVTATRILDGQLRGESGEENSLVYRVVFVHGPGEDLHHRHAGPRFGRDLDRHAHRHQDRLRRDRRRPRRRARRSRHRGRQRADLDPEAGGGRRSFCPAPWAIRKTRVTRASAWTNAT